MATLQRLPRADVIADDAPVHAEAPADRITGVRNMDASLWRRMRIAALRRGLTTGGALSEAIRDWLAGQDPDTPRHPN